MRTIICGSVAFDTIKNFDGQFRDHILPDRLHAGFKAAEAAVRGSPDRPATKP
jgi:hypothetical protein